MVASKTKLDTAKEIARSHFRIDPDVLRIFLLEPVKEDDPLEPIKLLEVTDGAIEHWIEPVSFPSNDARGIPFPSMIVELSPAEFERIDPSHIPFRQSMWTLGEELTL